MQSSLNHKKLTIPAVGLVLAMLLGACAPLSAIAQLPFFENAESENEKITQAQPVQEVDGQQPENSVNAASVAALQGTLRDIYDRVNPSVVNIQVTSPVNLQDFPGLPGNGDDLQLPNQSALGSGFVWDKEGYIVTNNHVVEDASNIRVVFSNGREYSAELIGADPDSDLAVIKADVPSTELFPITMGDSEILQVGDLSIAIGNPFGLDGTMTVGIISALGRSLSVENGTATGYYSIPDIIQTDAAINPGNSGGVLLNAAGQVIGVTTAIESTDGSNSGIGFAVPAAIVNNVVPELIQTGVYTHSWLGLSGGTLQADIAEAMDLERDQRGILVASVVEDGPAGEAGLLGSTQDYTYEGAQVQIGGDIITAIDGRETETFDDLVSYLASDTRPGQEITLDILRDGKAQQVNVVLGSRPGKEQANSPATSAFSSGQTYLGITGGSLVPEIATAMDLPEDQAGVLVVAVAVDSPAEKAGLLGSTQSVTISGQDIQIGGDVITAINDTEIDGIQALRQELANYQPEEIITLTILRDGEEMQVEVTLAAKP
jgi:S1-C subfamily serine protease